MPYLKHICLINSFLFFNFFLNGMEIDKSRLVYLKEFKPWKNSHIAYTSNDENGKVDTNFANMVMAHCPQDLQNKIKYYKELIKKRDDSLPNEKNISRSKWFPILLTGQTGCGKTTLAKVLAAQMEVPYTCVATPALPTESEGEALKRLNEIFEDKFSSDQPHVLILDELSGLTNRHKNNNNPDQGLVEKFKQLLKQSETFDRQKVLVIATLCAQARIPRYLLFSFMIEDIPSPDFEQRKALVNFYVPTAHALLSKKLEGFLKELQGRTPREIKDLLEDAMLSVAIRKRAQNSLENNTDVTIEDLYASLEDFREIERKIIPRHPMLSNIANEVGPHMRWIIPMAITIYCTAKFKDVGFQHCLSWFHLRGIIDSVIKDIK